MTFHFASPRLLLLLLIPLLLALWPLSARLRRQPATLQYSDVRLTTHLSPSWRQRLRFILPVFRLLALALLIIALARPPAGSAREIVIGNGIDIAIVLDISGSMAALDFEPNRLGAAKRVIHDFFQQRNYDRIGLVIFASEAFSQVPPTLDYKVLERVLDDTHLAFCCPGFCSGESASLSG